jgi:hypothetical protein
MVGVGSLAFAFAFGKAENLPAAACVTEATRDFFKPQRRLTDHESARRCYQLLSRLPGAIRNPGNENACRNSGDVCVAP